MGPLPWRSIHLKIAPSVVPPSLTLSQRLEEVPSLRKGCPCWIFHRPSVVLVCIILLSSLVTSNCIAVLLLPARQINIFWQVLKHISITVVLLLFRRINNLHRLFTCGCVRVVIFLCHQILLILLPDLLKCSVTLSQEAALRVHEVFLFLNCIILAAWLLIAGDRHKNLAPGATHAHLLALRARNVGSDQHLNLCTFDQLVDDHACRVALHKIGAHWIAPNQ
mmetsp:Transcript_97161/g.168470  ORF Transcript_97161/g.168470 Transcript_97161/m.168470 type:complete len:222 (+) Transcript_97161:179-844(+)